MAQTIKIKRGGLANLVTTTPTLAQGELLLATGSLNGLGSTLFVATASNSPNLPYAKIESIANGGTLASSLDDNFDGLLIHSSSDNKLYRYDGTTTTFVELPIAAGSFEGILPVVVQNGTDTIVGGSDGPVVLTLGGGVVTGSAQIDGASIENNGIGFTYSGGGISGGATAILNGSIELTVTTGSIVAGSNNLVNAGVINTLSASIATDIINNTGNSVSGSGGFTFASDVLTVGASTFGTNTTIAGDLTVNGTTTTVNSTQVDIGDRIITLNSLSNAGDGGIYVNDNVTAQTGSLLWDSAGDYWKAGIKDSEKRIVTFTAANPTNDSFIHLNSSDEVVAIASGSTVGAFLQKTAAGFEVSAVIDGGTF